MEIDNTLQSAAASAPSLSLTVESSHLTAFYELLQAGFRVRCKVGVTIESLFSDQFGINKRLVEEKISTIFLNGKPVDDITSTIVNNGSTLALSGAMPGLVGATLRRESPLASFRQSISAGKSSEDKENSEGCIQIKLFNILLKELGQAFLERGILLPTGELKAFFNKQPADFWQRCTDVALDGQSIDPAQLTSKPLTASSGMILLSVTTSS